MSSLNLPRLGVNIDHLATLRQLRGTSYPSLLEAVRMIELAGASQITVHLREDRRHIQPDDVKLLRAHCNLPLNLEMAVTPEMLKFARKIKPEWACLVPEKRQEVTTEGGLDLKKHLKRIRPVVDSLKKAGIKVSLFVEPSVEAMKLSAELGADAVELHTGTYCLAAQASGEGKLSKKAQTQLARIQKAGQLAASLGIHVHAGHGIDLENVRPLVALERKGDLPLIEEYNIGHFLVCRASLYGMEHAVREMLSAIQAP